MARTAVPGRLAGRRTWRPADLVDRRVETSSASTLRLRVDEWPGHLAGQHIDVRLTAPDGYQAARSYSLSAPADGDLIDITVQRTEGGEVSPFLVDDLSVGAQVEVRGPVGGWFVWRPDATEPVLLVAGGSGIVPLMAMIRARESTSSARFQLVYSVRSPGDRIYADELRRRATNDSGFDVSWIYTRVAPSDDPRPAGRSTPDDLAISGWSATDGPTCYICGPTGFVESVAGSLLDLGHDASQIRTERFGGG